MEKRKKPPITCSQCAKEFCAPCGQFATPIDYKTRTGICKKCFKADGSNVTTAAAVTLSRLSTPPQVQHQPGTGFDSTPSRHTG